MNKLDILNKKRIKEISKLIENQWGCKYSFEGYTVLISPKDKFYIINNDLSKVPFDRLKINSIGLYFGEINRGQVRLSMEGCFHIGKIATKNILVLSDKQQKEWMSGQDVDLDEAVESNFYIIKNENEDILGCGKAKEKILFNYVPKERRI